MSKPIGWRGESARHADAARGRKTGKKQSVKYPSYVKGDFTSTEAKARDAVSTKTKLKKRLKDAKRVLYDKYSSRFKKETIDFENKRMVSDDGELALQWELRDKPNEPVSYENQQTNRGDVALVRLK
jgi:hypothetical protein